MLCRGLRQIAFGPQWIPLCLLETARRHVPSWRAYLKNDRMESNMKVTIRLNYKQTDCPHHLFPLHFNIGGAQSSAASCVWFGLQSPQRDPHKNPGDSSTLWNVSQVRGLNGRSENHCPPKTPSSLFWRSHLSYLPPELQVTDHQTDHFRRHSPLVLRRPAPTCNGD